jgi:hypothetical protein
MQKKFFSKYHCNKLNNLQIDPAQFSILAFQEKCSENFLKRFRWFCVHRVYSKRSRTTHYPELAERKRINWSVRLMVINFLI